MTLTPPNPMTPTVLAIHLATLLDPTCPVNTRRTDYPDYSTAPLMLRQGDHLEPLIQCGIHDGRIFVETWTSYEQRLMAGDH